MKNRTFKSTIVITVLSVVSLNVAQANGAPAVNPYEALTGNINLTPGFIDNQGIRWASVTFAGAINAQQTGAAVTPPAEGSSVFVSGRRAGARRLTVREVLTGMQTASLIPTITGYSLRYAKIGGVDYLQAFNRRVGESSAVNVPAELLQLSVGWADFQGVYNGSATFTATPTVASGTYVYPSAGFLQGLCEYSGSVGPNNLISADTEFSGVGNFFNIPNIGLWGGSAVSGVNSIPTN